MPKSYARKSAPRKYTTKKASNKKPYGGSRYGNDAFVKVEAIEPLTPNGGNLQQSFATMRVTNPGVISPGNTWLGDQAEFKSFQALYARYEVVGMKAEVTLNVRTSWSAANISGGFAPNLPAIATFPTEDANVSYPMQKDCNVQGEVTSLYYAYSKDLKNSGARHAMASTAAYPDQDQGVLQFRGVCDNNTNNAILGNIKFTWYVRFHGRTRLPVQIRRPLLGKENQDPEAAQSMMSYAELQQQLARLQAL